MTEKEIPKISIKETKKVLEEKKEFSQSLLVFLKDYLITSEKDVEELDGLVYPFFKLDCGKIVEIKFQNKIYRIKRCR